MNISLREPLSERPPLSARVIFLHGDFTAVLVGYDRKHLDLNKQGRFMSAGHDIQ
jgi:hypothetical protein